MAARRSQQLLRPISKPLSVSHFRYATMLVRQLLKGSTSTATHKQRTVNAQTAAAAEDVMLADAQP